MKIQKVNNSIESKEEDSIKVGDVFISSRNEDAIRIFKIKKDGEYINYEYEFLSDVLNLTWTLSQGIYSNTKKIFNSTLSRDSLKQYYKKTTQEDLRIWIEKAKKFLDSGELQSEFKQLDEEELNRNTSLVAINSKENLLAMQEGLEEKRNQLQGMETVLKLRMEEQKRRMDLMRRQIESTIEIFNKQITRLVRIVTMLELYLGIEEELIQLQEGPSADIDEPICFRQQILYMDEETSILDKGGLDFTRIDEFDAWLMKDQNYKILLPEKRGVVCLKPRRTEKDYGDAIRNHNLNKENLNQSYFLIRNGDNIYRIYTEKLIIPGKLFPSRDELTKLFDELNEKLEKEVFDRYKEEAKDKVEKRMYYYRKLAFFYQGLIDRSNVFHPIKLPLSVFKIEENIDQIKFIYDDDMTLPSGRLPFWEWHKKINRKIKRGSRILLTDLHKNSRGGWISKKEYDDRFYRYYSNEYNLPDLPSSGLYEVHELERDHSYWSSKRGEKYQSLLIRYNPGGKVYSSWRYESSERKNRISFEIFPEDGFIFNYDQIDTETIEFYLKNRADRRNYYLMIPMLKGVLEARAEELKWEKHFVQMVVDNAERKLKKIDRNKCEDFVWKCIEWWKNKVIMKRPITKDDTLALRMIEKRVLAEVNKKKYLL